MAPQRDIMKRVGSTARRVHSTARTLGSKAVFAQAHAEDHVRHPRLTIDNMNENLKAMQYAVRGEVPIAAAKLDREIASGRAKVPFDKILYCNIGNPQSVGQKPISFYRNVSSIVDNPRLLSNENLPHLRQMFDDYEIERAAEMISYIKGGTGAYSDSQGVLRIRENVAKFIENRDGYSADPSTIFLTNGASSGIQMLLTALIASPNDAVMIPIPQYPIYTAVISLLGGQASGYYLHEEDQWSLREDELERSYAESVANGHIPKAFVLINPGNPTGNTLSYESVATVVKFCHRHRLVLFSDEVYQENCYNKARKPFVSAKKVMQDLEMPIELASFHSTSKGFIGECGRRGGYMEVCNFDTDVMAQVVKLASSGLCSNLNGQVMTDLMVSPPTAGETKRLFEQERDEILNGLRMKAEMVHESLNRIPGVSCQPLEGAMYAFPRIELSQSFIEKAKKLGKAPDALYALSLLENTGICTVPGSGFEQEPGTFHLRLTFLPQPEDLEKAMKSFRDHHLKIA